MTGGEPISNRRERQRATLRAIGRVERRGHGLRAIGHLERPRRVAGGGRAWGATPRSHALI